MRGIMRADSSSCAGISSISVWKAPASCGVPPLPIAEVDASLRQDVEHADALRDLDRVVHPEGQADHAVADADPLEVLPAT